MEKNIKFADIVVDCADEKKLCDFYEGLLGWERREMFGHPMLASENGTVFLFVQEEDYVSPVWPEPVSYTHLSQLSTASKRPFPCHQA